MQDAFSHQLVGSIPRGQRPRNFSIGSNLSDPYYGEGDYSWSHGNWIWAGGIPTANRWNFGMYALFHTMGMHPSYEDLHRYDQFPAYRWGHTQGRPGAEEEITKAIASANQAAFLLPMPRSGQWHCAAQRPDNGQVVDLISEREPKHILEMTVVEDGRTLIDSIIAERPTDRYGCGMLQLILQEAYGSEISERWFP